jgi:hypothetical protein
MVKRLCLEKGEWVRRKRGERRMGKKKNKRIRRRMRERGLGEGEDVFWFDADR